MISSKLEMIGFAILKLLLNLIIALFGEEIGDENVV